MTIEPTEIFQLRLEQSTLERALEIATLHAIPLDEFIILALAEKITRTEEDTLGNPS